MVGWHHQLNGHKFEQTPGESEGQGSLTCCSSWGHRGLDMTEQMNNQTGKLCYINIILQRLQPFLFIRSIRDSFRWFLGLDRRYALRCRYRMLSKKELKNEHVLPIRMSRRNIYTSRNQILCADMLMVFHSFSLSHFSAYTGQVIGTQNMLSFPFKSLLPEGSKYTYFSFQRKLNSVHNLQPTTKSQHLILFYSSKSNILGGGSWNLLTFEILLGFTKYT